MCWSATTSFTTLAIGTSLNIASYVYLRHRRSATSLLVWSWQYALLMQVPEGIVWLQLDAGDRDVSGASRLAMFLNVTQPLALLLGIRLGGLFRGFRYAHVALGLYAVVILSQFDEIWSRSHSIAPNVGCPHLSLRYWDVSRGIVFLVTSLLIVSEARPVFWSVVNALLFILTFLLAILVYPCGVGSVWCWFIFITGPVLVICDHLQLHFSPSPGVAITPPPSLRTSRLHPTSTFVAHRTRI